MTSTANPYHCDYLNRIKLPPPFTSERAELAHINKQIISLGSHISQLTTLHHALLGRSRHLHNSLSPISKIPVEILSCIFEQLVYMVDFKDTRRYFYRACLRQAFTLTSVSSYFRRIALGIPELWRRIPLGIANLDAIDNASLLLRYCSALTPSLELAVETGKDLDDEEVSRSCVDALITPDITRKVKRFDLCGMHEEPSSSGLWIEKLKNLGSPMLNTLSIWIELQPDPSFDLRVLTTVNRLVSYSYITNTAILVPPLLQYLIINNVPVENLERLLRHCPNLVECDLSWDEELDSDIEFVEPLTLSHLKSLSVSGTDFIMSSTSVDKLHLPSLETLKLDRFERGVIPLCHNVSATLTSLRINTYHNTINDSMPQLRRMSFPKLEELDITLWRDYWDLPLNPVLEQLEDDHYHNPQLHYPVLRSIIIILWHTMTPSSLLEWLRESKIGRAFFFNIKFIHPQLKADDWSPDLREELRSIVGSRQIEVTWCGCKIYELGVRDSSG